MFIKRIIILPILTAVLLTDIMHTAYAISPSTEPSTTPKTEEKKPIDDTIKTIKEKIENKVEEINKTSKKVVAGILDKIEDDSLELTNEDGKGFKVSTDDTITKFFLSTVKKTQAIKRDDLEKGDKLIIFGPIIEDQISANKIFKQTPYITAQGEITNLDKDNFSIDMVTSDKEEVSLDIEESTTQRIMDTKKLTFAKAGFSKYKVGDRIHVVYVKPVKEGAKASVVRTLIIPQEFFTETATTPHLSPSPSVKPSAKKTPTGGN